MLTGKTQGQVQPYAYGSMTQASTYGVAIPNIIGCTQSPLLAIWAANTREGGSSKKFKQLKKGITTYCENITMMVGYNPIINILQMWNNGSLKGLDFGVQTFTTGTNSWTITDPHFYSVIAVTIENGGGIFDSGSGVPAAVLMDVPMWNAVMNGPDPTRSAYYRHYPFCYRWLPSYGNVVYSDSLDIFNSIFPVKIYYAKLNSSTNYQTPLAVNRLHFEKILGDGSEYTGNFLHTSTPLSTQQIKYPMYAGVGSDSIDLGASGTIPQLQAEVQGKWGLYTRGDADFVDMIEDIVKSGLSQSAIDSPTYAGHTPLGHGAGAFNYPGCVQIKCMSTAKGIAFPGSIQYDLNVTKGNFLVVIAETTDGTGSGVSLSDTLVNSWTPVFAGTPTAQVFWCQNATSDADSVSISGLGTNWSVTLLEVGGVDTFDGVAIGASGSASFTTTNQESFAEYMLSIGLYPGTVPNQSAMPLWTLMTDMNESGTYPALNISIQERTANYPGIVTTSIDTNGLTAQCILAFKCTQPAIYPQPVGSFLDAASLALTRKQDRANGLWGSISLSSQQSAKDYLDKLYTAANAAPIYVGDKLFSMPLSEVSAAANGAVYNSPYAGTPVLNLSTEKGDFLARSGPPVKLQTTAHTNEDNVLQLQCLNRNSNYNPAVVMQPEQGTIALYGLRKGAATQNNAIQDVAIGRKILGVEVKRIQYGAEDKYIFTLPAKYCLLAPMGAGGSGNYSPTTPPLPRQPASDESVMFAFGSAAGSGLGPFKEPIWTNNQILYGSFQDGTLSLTTGGTPGFVPDSLDAFWSGFHLPGLPNNAVITGIYPIAATQGNGGDGTLSIVSPSGAAFNANMITSPVTVAGMKTIINGLVMQQHHENTIAGGDSSSFSVLYAGVAIYVKGGYGSATYAPNPESPDIVDAVLTITDPLADFIKIPVRITSIKENEDLTLACEAEPYVYGMCAPGDFTVDTPTPYTPNPTSSPGSVNAPVFIEPTPRLSGSSGYQLPLWIVVSAPSVDYGGCIPMVSTDGGASYTALGGSIIGSAITGHNTADWPAAADPDTANNLALDLTESNGVLQSYAAVARDNFQYPCYIAGGGAYSIPYELFSYNAATMTGTNLYTIQATGTGNEIRRGIFAAPSPSVGVDHPTNSRFAFLDPSGTGMIKVNMDATWIGKTLYFKFLAFNTFGTAQQTLSDAVAYPYTPTGVPGSIGPANGFLVNGI